jgi:hypothetical protein
MEVVQRGKSSNHGSKRRRNLRIICIREVALSVHLVLVDLRMESAAKLAHVAGELDDLSARKRSGYAEPLSGQPCFDRSDVLVRRAELLAELLRRKPLVVVRMAWRVQLAHQLIERRLLAPAPLQHQVNPLQRCAIRCGSAIVLRVASGYTVPPSVTICFS